MFKLFEHGNTTTQIDVLDALLSSSECSPTKLKSPLTHFLVSAHLGRVSLLCDESVIIGGHLQSLPRRRRLPGPARSEEEEGSTPTPDVRGAQTAASSSSRARDVRGPQNVI